MDVRDPQTSRVVLAAVEVHRCLGPGLLESAYRECLAREFTLRQIPFQREVALTVTYKGAPVPVGYRLDMVVEDEIVVEVKSLEVIHSVHAAQTLTYMRLGGYRRGLLINFNVPLLKKGVRRLVNDWKPL